MVQKYQTPDLYFERTSDLQREARGPISRAPIHATAFLGFANRGPMGKPQWITSWSSCAATIRASRWTGQETAPTTRVRRRTVTLIWMAWDDPGECVPARQPTSLPPPKKKKKIM